MIQTQALCYPSRDGIHEIRARLWLPEGEPRAIVQLVHGIAEYIDRYDAFARALAEAGYLVAGEDHLGHGMTAAGDDRYGVFAERNGWMTVTDDVYALSRQLHDTYPALPRYMLGHSMGSFLVRTVLCRYPGQISGAILSGTGQEAAPLVACGRLLSGLLGLLRGRAHVSPLVHGMALGAYNRSFSPARTAADWISRDEAVVDAYLADPQCQPVPSVGLYRDMMTGLQYIARRKNLRRMDPATPVYLYSGDCDPVGGFGRGVRKVCGYFLRCGTADLTLRLYPGGRHEMHNELNREAVYADVLRWLEAHTG